MDVGIVGSGIVGRTLGRGFASRGDSVTLGTRTPDRADLREWAAEAGASVGSFADAADARDAIVIATAWSGTEPALLSAGHERFAGKLVIDATNPLDFSKGPPPRLAIGGNDSAGEWIQRTLPAARVVKCFNIVGNALMVNPQLPGGPPTILIAGNDDAARALVTEILASFGWETADLGGIEAARWLEAMAMAWVWYGMRAGSWNHAFKLLRG